MSAGRPKMDEDKKVLGVSFSLEPEVRDKLKLYTKRNLISASAYINRLLKQQPELQEIE